jgi:hypothetical protein
MRLKNMVPNVIAPKAIAYRIINEELKVSKPNGLNMTKKKNT